jgi:hypothetical protein
MPINTGLTEKLPEDSRVFTGYVLKDENLHQLPLR